MGMTITQKILAAHAGLDKVEAGQLIGSVGDTAMIEIAEEPHLHMEMTVKGLQVDPLDYFSQEVLNALTEDSIYESETDK